MRRMSAQQSWVMYDWAHSAFSTTILVAVLPIFYQNVAAQGIDATLATSFWGYSQSLSVIIIALLAPFLGAIADYSHAKKKFLAGFLSLGILGCIALVFVGQGDYLLASAIFIVASVGYSGGNIFYDSFLPELASKKRMDQLSTRGLAYGYLGGGLLLLVNLLMIMKPHWFGIPDVVTASKLSFVSVGIWWFVFALPLFRHLKESPAASHSSRSSSYITIGVSRVTQTMKDIAQYKELTKFFIAFWLFNDGIATIMKMATIYGAQLGIGQTDLIAALVITQFVGIPCTFFFGWLTQKITAKRALFIALWVFVCIVILGYFMTSAWHFYVLAFMVGLVQGGAHALSRSIYGKMVPTHKSAEFFGFYGVFAKFSAILGPFVFAISGQLTGSSRIGILSVLIFFLLGIILLKRVNIEQGIQEAQQARS